MLAGAFGPTPRKKALEDRYGVEMHVHSKIFHGQLKEKIRPIILKMSKIGSKKIKNIFCFKQISKCDTCFYMHFSRAFQKNSYRSVAFVTKKILAILDFFTDRTFFYLT